MGEETSVEDLQIIRVACMSAGGKGVCGMSVREIWPILF